MTNHLWFIADHGVGKSTLAHQMMTTGPSNARYLSGRISPAYLAEVLQENPPPGLVILDIEEGADGDTWGDGDTWAVVLHNATALGGHMTFVKGRARFRLVVPDECQIAVFSPPIKDTHIERLSTGRGRFQFAVIGQVTP